MDQQAPQQKRPVDVAHLFFGLITCGFQASAAVFQLVMAQYRTAAMLLLFATSGLIVGYTAAQRLGIVSAARAKP